MTMFGTIAAAIIAAVPATLIAVNQDSDDAETVPFSLVQSSDLGSVDNVTLSDSRTAVALSGSANPFVDAVGVVIFEPTTKKPISTEITDVSDGKWSLVAISDLQIPEPFGIMAAYKERTATASGITKASGLTFRLVPPPSPAPPPPGPQDGCSTQSIENCFTGPGWGAPSIYRSES
ncbi:hypothetical protein [Mycolicibacterium sp. XJ870]